MLRSPERAGFQGRAQGGCPIPALLSRRGGPSSSLGFEGGLREAFKAMGEAAMVVQQPQLLMPIQLVDEEIHSKVSGLSRPFLLDMASNREK